MGHVDKFVSKMLAIWMAVSGLFRLGVYPDALLRDFWQRIWLSSQA